MSGAKPYVQVGVSAAAAQLGVSVEAIRKRIHRGSLDAEKVDGRWMVLLPPDDTVQDAAPEPTELPRAVQPLREAPDRTHDVQAYRELVATLRSEVEFLRGELQARGEDLRRRDETIAELMYGMAAPPSERTRAWPPWRRRDK